MKWLLSMWLLAQDPVGKVISTAVSLTDSGNLQTLYLIQSTQLKTKPGQSLTIYRQVRWISETLAGTEKFFWQPIARVKVLHQDGTLILTQMNQPLLPDSIAYILNRPVQGDVVLAVE